MIKKLKLYTVMCDNQDGSFLAVVFGSLQERDKWLRRGGTCQRSKGEPDLTKEDLEDTYQYGYPDETEARYKLVNGEIILIGNFCFGTNNQ